MTIVDVALLVLRLVLGVTFLFHGSQKLFGWFGGAGIKGSVTMMTRLGAAHAVLLGWLAALTEFGGGLLVLLGLFTPLGAALIVSVMITAIVYVHAKNGFSNTNKGYEFNLNLIAEAVALLLLGGGAVSLDSRLGIAVPLNLLPWWVVVILVLVVLGGVVSTELSKHAATPSGQPGADQTQPAR